MARRRHVNEEAGTVGLPFEEGRRRGPVLLGPDEAGLGEMHPRDPEPLLPVLRVVLGQSREVLVEDPRIEAYKDVDIRIAHGDDEAGHAAQVVADDAERPGVGERQRQGFGHDEFHVPGLGLDVLDGEIDQPVTRAEERAGRHHVAVRGQELAKGEVAQGGLIEQSLSEDEQGVSSRRGGGGADGPYGRIPQLLEGSGLETLGERHREQGRAEIAEGHPDVIVEPHRRG